jgi:hypothetical protein
VSGLLPLRRERDGWGHGAALDVGAAVGTGVFCSGAAFNAKPAGVRRASTGVVSGVGATAGVPAGAGCPPEGAFPPQPCTRPRLAAPNNRMLARRNHAPGRLSAEHLTPQFFVIFAFPIMPEFAGSFSARASKHLQTKRKGSRSTLVRRLD